MSDLNFCIGLILLGAWLGFGIRWAFWIWDSISKLVCEFCKWLLKRRNR